MILQFRCPPELKDALEAKANDEMTSVSAYMRRLLLQGLASQGMAVTRAPDPAKSQNAAA
jgi:hypothetical protein